MTHDAEVTHLGAMTHGAEVTHLGAMTHGAEVTHLGAVTHGAEVSTQQLMWQLARRHKLRCRAKVSCTPRRPSPTARLSL